MTDDNVRLVDKGNYFTHSRIAESKDTLIHQFSASLINRQRDQEGRERIVASHLGAIDGASWQRVLAVTHWLANRMSA